MSRILFSPIGGSDPIRNFRDGSMLHICRNYLPDKVVLYLSYEMCQYHEKDNRYLYCLEKLGEYLNHPFEVELIKRPELKNVQKYEIFYHDFISCIAQIEQNMTGDDELYLNISSGTPAMKSALVLISALTEYPLKPIQISTPLKKANHTDENMDNYEVEEQWECNEDNEKILENRCEELQSVNLVTLLKLNIIKKHIEVYDYAAAYQVAKDMEKMLPSRGMLFLEQALERKQLNVVKVNVIAKQTGFQPMPCTKVKECSIVEYILLLQIKLKCREYDDFVRAITPIIFELLERALEKQCHIDPNNYSKTDSRGVRRWSPDKLKGTDILRELQEEYNGNFKYGPIYSDHLKKLLLAFSKNTKMNSLVENVRSVEENARNKAAHTVVSITEDQIIRWTGVKPVQIMENIKQLAEMIMPEIEKTFWASYDAMNKKIMQELENR